MTIRNQIKELLTLENLSIDKLLLKIQKTQPKYKKFMLKKELNKLLDKKILTIVWDDKKVTGEFKLQNKIMPYVNLLKRKSS